MRQERMCSLRYMNASRHTCSNQCSVLMLAPTKSHMLLSLLLDVWECSLTARQSWAIGKDNPREGQVSKSLGML